MSQRSEAVDAAAETLYGAPLDSFTTERKRLADEIRRGGDRAAAAEVAKLPKPGLSTWVINQLHRQATTDLESLFAVGEQLREGDLSATAELQATLAKLRQRAAELLTTAGHAASETTMRRVGTTLQALSAIGTFAPDRPGQLVADRDPPGFEAHLDTPFALSESSSRRVIAQVKPTAAAAEPTLARETPEDRARKREAERLAAELRRAERDADKAQREVDERTAEIADLRARLGHAELALAEAKQRVEAAARAVEAARVRAEAGA